MRCDDPREVRLFRDFSQWLPAIAETWRDRIDNAWPLNLHVVHPTPPMTRDVVTNQIHLLVVQRTADGNHANVFTRIDATETVPRVDFAAYAPAVLDKNSIIHTSGYDHKCHPERSHLQCMVWHGDFEIRGRVAARNRPGLSFLLIYNDIPRSSADAQPMTTTELWDFPDDDGVLLQTSVNKTTPMILKLEELIPPTTAVRLIDGSGHQRLPTPLEVALPGTAAQVEAELQLWGHQCNAFEGATQAVFLCLDRQEPQQETLAGFHYFFCHDDPTDDQGCFLHSDMEILTEVHIMRLLCSLGYARAVVLHYDHLQYNWYRIVFHHREPATTADKTKKTEQSTWPPRNEHRRTVSCLIECPQAEDEVQRCALTTAFDNKDLEELFESGWDILITNFDILHLDETLTRQLQCHVICPLKQISDLDHYDRLLIYTDGSSIPAMRRIPPSCADDQGHPDTWAFVAVAETFLDEHSSKLTVLGWTAQPVRYDVEGSAYTGVTRIGSDSAHWCSHVAVVAEPRHPNGVLYGLCTMWWTSKWHCRGCGTRRFLPASSRLVPNTGHGTSRWTASCTSS